MTVHPLLKRNPRAFHLNRKYGLSLKQYDSLLKRQNGVCAMCKNPETRMYKGAIRHLSVDHNHACCPGDKTCGKCIRGLLCAECNQVLGYFKDNPARFQAAIDYLKG